MTYQKPKVSRKRNSPSLYQLDVNQTLQQYKELEATWYRNIRASGFHDIEKLDYRGYSSAYSVDYSLGQLRKNYTAAKLEYYRRASIFNWEFQWSNEAFKPYSTEFCRFIWLHHSSGHTLRQIVKAFNQPHSELYGAAPPLQRFIIGIAQRPPSLFTVFTVTNKVLEPTFKAWCGGTGAAFLTIDWDL